MLEGKLQESLATLTIPVGLGVGGASLRCCLCRKDQTKEMQLGVRMETLKVKAKVQDTKLRRKEGR